MLSLLKRKYIIVFAGCNLLGVQLLDEKGEDELKQHSSEGDVEDGAPVAAGGDLREVGLGRERKEGSDVEAADNNGELPIRTTQLNFGRAASRKFALSYQRLLTFVNVWASARATPPVWNGEMVMENRKSSVRMPTESAVRNWRGDNH